MKYIFAAVLVTVTSLTYADGPTTLHGTNAAGELITVDQEYFDYGPQGVAWGPNMFHTVLVKKDGKNIQSYEKQLCGYDRDGHFSCAKKGESPLAGAIYVKERELPYCDGTLYVCEGNCPERAPRKLVKDPWECDDPAGRCRNSPEKGKVNGDDVNIRETPSLDGRILRKVSRGTKVNVMERDIYCLDIYPKLGRWVRVKIIDDGPVKEGWMYDAYIDPPGKEFEFLLKPRR